MPDEPPITTLLQSWRAGDHAARDQLIARVYPDLRRLAAHYLRGHRSTQTLQPTALVHELYIRLVSGAAVEWQDRAHFFALAARKLRHILVDHARKTKRRGSRQVVLGPAVDVHFESFQADILALDDAMHQLEGVHDRACRVLELQFVGGLTDAEAAEVLGISVATVRRDSRFGRAWLSVHLGAEAPDRAQS